MAPGCGLTDERCGFSQKGAHFLRSERVGAGRHTGEQRVLQSILHAKLLKVCCCLGDLVAHGVEQKKKKEVKHRVKNGTLKSYEASGNVDCS